MVSRNAGWNMTDLKGSYLSKLLTEQNQEDFFLFLERGNWLIFQDAYPQLRLYEESRKKKQNLFHLLPLFGVSSFMEVMWNHFYDNRNHYLISTALIINEQTYIEKRMVQHTQYQLEVLKSLEFQLQDLLGLNQILFPVPKEEKVKVVGQSVHHFASLHDRILLGKRLYQLLFDKDYYDHIYQWAVRQPHTGSRQDFWPDIFHSVNEAAPHTVPEVEKCQLKENSPRIYSPFLEDVWDNTQQKPAEQGDWYTNSKVVRYLKKNELKLNADMQKEYCNTLEKLHFAVVAKGVFS